MEPRLVIAYALLLLIAASLVAVLSYCLYHSPYRSYQRRLRRETRAYVKAMTREEAESK